MAATKKKKPAKVVPTSNGALAAPVAAGDVLTLAETAAYLRLAEADVVELIQTQALPGRLTKGEWRFLKPAVQAWLSTPTPQYSKEAQLAVVGSWKNDPFVEQELKEIYERRRQPPGGDSR